MCRIAIENILFSILKNRTALVVLQAFSSQNASKIPTEKLWPSVGFETVSTDNKSSKNAARFPN